MAPRRYGAPTGGLPLVNSRPDKRTLECLHLLTATATGRKRGVQLSGPFRPPVRRLYSSSAAQSSRPGHTPPTQPSAHFQIRRALRTTDYQSPYALLLEQSYIFQPHHSMFDPRLCSPDSPVDSAMFPPVYNRSSSASSTTSMASSPDATPVAPASAANPVVKPMTPASFKQELLGPSVGNELEPFEFRPHPAANPTPRSAAGTSLSSVFGDQDLIDAIMCSLNVEQSNNNNVANAGLNVAIPAFSPATFSPLHRRLQQVQVPPPQSFTALMQQRPHAVAVVGNRAAMTGPCLRKPGTFLNKDGRWIKGKPCRIEGCDKRAQSNGLCKGHGGGARCSFAGCSKSSQGGGFCRAHGGGKRCMHEGCEKGTQRNGFCYLHGGVRSCSFEGCDKKDRGNGRCFSHGGGRKCQAHMCFNTIRRGAFCDLHNGKMAK